MGREPGFTHGRVYYRNTHLWFNIEKARQVLGYEPDVGIEEGIKRTIVVSWEINNFALWSELLIERDTGFNAGSVERRDQFV